MFHVKHRAKMCVILLLLVFLGACAGKMDVITVSATTAAIVGEQAVATNSNYVALCAAGKITPQKCQAWATWFRGFQRDYAAAHAAFRVATVAGDITSAQDAANRIQALATQLVLYSVYSQ